MSRPEKKEGKKRSTYSLNLALAMVAGLVGCVTLIIVSAAILAGLWLDNQLNTSPIFLATILIGSVPITVLIMLWIVRSITSRMKTSTSDVEYQTEEDAIRGTNA